MRFWKKRLQRVAAMVCSVALVASMMPTAVFATEPEATTPTPEPTPIVATTPTPEPSESPENTDATVTTSAPDTGTGSTSAPEATPAGNTDDTKEPVESPEPSEEPTDDTTESGEEGTETTDSTTVPNEENVEQQVSVPQTLAAAPAADGEPETRSGPDGTNSELGNEYITVYYNHSATAADNRTLTVKVQDETGTSLCDDLTIGNVTLTTMTRVTLDQSKYATYKIQSCELNGGGGITQIPASLNNDQNKTFTLNAITDNSVLVVTLQQIQNKIIDLTDSKAGGKSFGSILYKEDESVSQTTNVHIYLNNEFVKTVEDLKLPSDVAGPAAGNDDSFVLTLNDGYYFAPYDVDGTVEVCTASTVSSEQHITWCKDTRNGLYSYLNYSLPDANGTNDITLNFFTYEEGVRADFTRYVNGDVVYASGGGVSAACEDLNIRFTYNGIDYTVVYDTWGQAQTIFLPRDTYIYVEPVIKDGFDFVYWHSDDAWTQGNGLYSVLPDGSLEQEETGLTDEQKGLVALTQTMAIYYNAGGYVRAQIGLHMTDGGSPEIYNEVYYHSNYPVEAGKKNETEISYYYPWLDYGTRIENCMFSVDGYTFAGWNTQEDGEGTSYTAGEYFHDKHGNDLILYAQWEKIETPQPGIPDVNVEDLGDEVVTIKCINTAMSHPEMESAILGDLNTDYRVDYGADKTTATITIIRADKYVEAYNTEHGKPEHTASQISDDEIKVKYDATAKEWVIDSSDNTATVDVTCEDTAVTSVDLEKTITQVKRGNEVFAGQNIPQMLKVGDEITYQIKVTNDGDTNLSNVTVTDTFNGAGSLSFGSVDKDDIQTNDKGFTWTPDGTLAPEESKTLTYTYTVVNADKGNTITNAATVNVDGEDPTDDGKTETEVEDPDVTVTKSLTAITRNGESVTPQDDTELKVGDEITYEIKVVNTGNVNLSDLTVTDEFSGYAEPGAVQENDSPVAGAIWQEGKTDTDPNWTLTIDDINLNFGESKTYTYTYTVNQADAGNTLTNTAAVSGDDTDPDDEETDEHPVEDDGTVTIYPADITIYKGGESGSTSVVEDENGTIAENNSLPTPGFYFDLPDAVNAAVSAYYGVASAEAVDLSDFITITAKAEDGSPRVWKLEKYGEGETSFTTIGGQEHYIYKLVAGDGQDPVRVQFTDDQGNFVTSDDFTLEDAMCETYTMQIYTGSVDTSTLTIKVEIPKKDDVPAQTFHCGYGETQTATLTVRHVNGEQEEVVTDAVTAITDVAQENTPLENAYVVADSDAVFNVNDSSVSVNQNSVSLLFDDLTTSAAGTNEAVERLLAIAEENSGLTGTIEQQAKYLNLVDADNGNAWLTAEGDVTIYWPYPEGTDKNTKFSLLHFDGIDREMAIGNLVSEVEGVTPKTMTITKDDYGIFFTTKTFSPFVLMWETEQPSGGEDEPSGGDDGNNDNNNNNNNNNTNANNQTTTVNVANQAAAPAAAPAAAVIPQTGDDMPVGLLAGLALVAAGGLAALLVLRKRRSDR